MDIINNIDFSITSCDVSDMITEINRFLFHIMLLHVITYTIDGKDELFGNSVFKTMFITAMAVISYHILFKKLINSKLKKIQSICKKD
jgi:hypothetical protein